MESTRPIRALVRGLDALTVLNSHDGVTVSEVARHILLPRTTVYRILETLCEAGFAFRDGRDERYRLTNLVRRLSGGFHDERWVSQIAKPCIDELCRDILWPVSVATLSGLSMVLREATDHDTPLAFERFSAGFRVPLLGSSAGLAYLAFCPRSERDNLLDRLAQSNKAEDKEARAPREELRRMLATIDAEGYGNIVGRIKDMVIRGGENLFPREIEEFLYSHPAIADVQVVGLPDPRYGEELCAWIQVHPGQTMTEADVRAFCDGQIAHHKIPRYVRFVEAFPMTVTGKVQKFRIRQEMIETLGLTVQATA